MKLKILLFNIIFYSCSTLGFGDFENENSPLTNEAHINSGSDMIKVEFIYQPLIGGKHEVFLTGDFNNWSESSIKMDDSDGIYTKTMYLKKGKYSYKYIVDGQWVVDEKADDFIDDCFVNDDPLCTPFSCNSLEGESSQLISDVLERDGEPKTCMISLLDEARVA